VPGLSGRIAAVIGLAGPRALPIQRGIDRIDEHESELDGAIVRSPLHGSGHVAGLMGMRGEISPVQASDRDGGNLSLPCRKGRAVAPADMPAGIETAVLGGDLLRQGHQPATEPQRDQRAVTAPPAWVTGCARRDPEHDRVLRRVRMAAAAKEVAQAEAARFAGPGKYDLDIEVARRRDGERAPQRERHGDAAPVVPG